MSPQPTLYRISPGAAREELTLDEVWSQSGSGPLATGYSQIVPLTVGEATYLLGVDAATGKGAAFQTLSADPWLAPVSSEIDLGGPCDIVEPFVLGSAPYLLAYVAKTGDFSFYPIGANLGAGTPYKFNRVRQPGPTKDFTVTQPVVVNGLVYVLCYSFDTGDVNAYSLQVTATPAPGSPPGTPPLLALPIWVHQWARDWTRFAFFQLGAENFFLKTNVGKLNVNIDHVLDDPTQGTVEVGTYLELDDALEIDIVRAFYLGGGDPYFLTYMKTGATTLYRFHGDCQGWTKQADGTTPTDATLIIPYTIGGDTFALYY